MCELVEYVWVDYGVHCFHNRQPQGSGSSRGVAPAGVGVVGGSYTDIVSEDHTPVALTPYMFLSVVI